MLIFGYNPLMAFENMFNFALGTSRGVGSVLASATPLIFTALGFAVANSAGFFNIGLSGQAICGWVASVWFALSHPEMPKMLMLPLAIIIGALAGAIAAAIPGALRAFFGTSEVITTIMLNYVYLYVSNYLLSNVFSQKIRDGVSVTHQIPHNASLTVNWLKNMTSGSQVSGGLFLALVFLVIVWFVMKKTTLGFEIRAVGLNPNASEYAGISSKRTIITSMAISGGLAGLGGVVEGLGRFQNFSQQATSLQIGFDGMAVSLLGAGSSIGILISAILFAILQVGKSGMALAGVPQEIASVVSAAIIFFVAINFVIRLLLAKCDRKNKNDKIEKLDKDEKIKEETNVSSEGGTI